MNGDALARSVVKRAASAKNSTVGEASPNFTIYARIAGMCSRFTVKKSRRFPPSICRLAGKTPDKNGGESR